MNRIALFTAMLVVTGLVGITQSAVAADGAAGSTPSVNGTGSVLDTTPTQAPNYPRSTHADSTLTGGSAVAFPNGGVKTVAYPDPCVSNPSLSGCGTAPTDPPPPDDGTGGAGTPPPSEPPPEEEPMGHCGLPPDWGKNADPDCVPVEGGWQCTYFGSGTVYYMCP